MIKIYNNDFNNFNEEVKANLILTDIPYNIGINAYASNPQWWKNGDVSKGRSSKAESKFFESDENFSIDNFLLFCKKHLKENSSAIIFCSIEELGEIILKYKKYGFKKYIPLVFIKNNSAEVLKANMRIVGACEYGVQLFNGSLGKFNNNKKMVKNWQVFNNFSKKLHPNEKPQDLLELFITLFTDENDLILDSCAGSGSLGVACKKLNRNCILIEKDKKYFDIIKERLEE